MVSYYYNSTWKNLPAFGYTVAPQEEGTNTKMLSGKIRKRLKGARIVISGNIPFIPQTMHAELSTLSRTGNPIKLKYTDEDGTTYQRDFYVTPIEATVFKYEDGEPVWVNVPFNAESVEVY